MLPLNPAAGSKAQRKLIKLFSSLNDARQQQLLEFAEFLVKKQASSAVDENPAPIEPVIIPRPENESVIGAIKRLSKSYSMLNKDDMLHETSDLMTSHVLKGRPVEEVIDELEILFVTHYEKKYQPGKGSKD